MSPSPAQPIVGAIIPAGGQSRRFSDPGGLRKQFRKLHGKPLLVHTLERIWSVQHVGAVAVAVPEDDLAYARDLLQPLSPAGVKLMVVAGGATRQASVAAGLAALPEAVEVVVVHDAVRPLFDPQWIAATIALCEEFAGAIVAVPSTDTLKEVRAGAKAESPSIGAIIRTVPRGAIWRAQTPQSFRAGILRQALQQAQETGATGTDEAALVEALGGTVAVVEGSPGNIKITTADDWDYLTWRLGRVVETQPDV